MILLRQRYESLSLVCLVFFFLSLISAADSNADLQRLMEKLLRSYTKNIRPSDTTTVSFGISIVGINEFDEVNHVLDLRTWSRQSWVDPRLRWSPEDFGSQSHIQIEADRLWKPDLTLYNSARGKSYTEDSLAVVYSDGTVLFIPEHHITSHCAIDLTHFPFDTQTCNLTYGSWTHNGNQINFTKFEGDSPDLSDYQTNNHWSLVNSSHIIDNKFYPCCTEPYPTITIGLKFKRNSQYYSTMFITPAFIGSLLIPVTFLIPTTSNNKLPFGLFMIFVFLMLHIAVSLNLPHSQPDSPLFLKFYSVNLVLSGVATFLVALLQTVYKSAATYPSFLKKVLLTPMECLCCMRPGKDMYDTQGSGGNYPFVELGDETSSKQGFAVEDKIATVSKHQSSRCLWIRTAEVFDRLIFIIYAIIVAISISYFLKIGSI